jgi:hypothetical protein
VRAFFSAANVMMKASVLLTGGRLNDYKDKGLDGGLRSKPGEVVDSVRLLIS